MRDSANKIPPEKPHSLQRYFSACARTPISCATRRLRPLATSLQRGSREKLFDRRSAAAHRPGRRQSREYQTLQLAEMCFSATTASRASMLDPPAEQVGQFVRSRFGERQRFESGVPQLRLRHFGDLRTQQDSSRKWRSFTFASSAANAASISPRSIARRQFAQVGVATCARSSLMLRQLAVGFQCLLPIMLEFINSRNVSRARAQARRLFTTWKRPRPDQARPANSPAPGRATLVSVLFRQSCRQEI